MSCLTSAYNPNLLDGSSANNKTLDLIYVRNPQELECAGIIVKTPPVFNSQTCQVTTPGTYAADTTANFESRWSVNSVCPTVYQIGIFAQQCIPVGDAPIVRTGNPFNPVAYSQIQQEMSTALYTFFSNHPFDENPFSSSILQNELMSACVNVPGVCELSESQMCKSCSRQRISGSVNLLEYCGCYAPTDPQFNSTVSPQCDYLCTTAASSKLRDAVNGGVIQCSQTTCIINNVSINSVNSTTANITLDQVCNQCVGSNTCKCFIDVSIPNVISNMGLNETTFATQCPFATCYTTDSNGNNPQNVDCASYVAGASKNVEYAVSPEVWWVLIAFFVLCVFVIFSFAYWGQNFKQSSFGLWKSPPLKGDVRNFSSKKLPS